MAINFPSSPTTGQSYTDTTTGQTWIYNGTGWSSSYNRSSVVRQSYTASAGQTTFTVSGGYAPGLLDVYQNGVKLVSGSDYTATNGTTFILTAAATAGDSIEAWGVALFAVANAPTITQFDAAVNTINSRIGVDGSVVMRNKIINGDFNIWQRGTATGAWVAPISNYYWADRWLFNSSGTGGNGSVSRQDFTPGQTDVPGEPTYFLRWQITSAASGQSAGGCYVEQRVEEVRTLAGSQATLTFYAKGTGTLPNIYAVQNFGSGGSAQVSTMLASSVVLNATWTKYTYTFTFPSIVGKTIGADNYVGITIMVPINSTYTLDLAQVQLEAGSVSTPFEQLPPQQELALCQRYFSTGPANSSGARTASSSGTFNAVDVYFKVEMRAAPTVALSGLAYSNCSSASLGATSTQKVSIRVVTSAAATYTLNSGTYTADAEL